MSGSSGNANGSTPSAGMVPMAQLPVAQPTNNASGANSQRGHTCISLLLLLQINLQYGFAKRLYDGRGGWC
jgi:hypothetical protein